MNGGRTIGSSNLIHVVIVYSKGNRNRMGHLVIGVAVVVGFGVHMHMYTDAQFNS